MLEMPYVYIAAGLLVLGFVVMFLHLPAITSARPAEDSPEEGRSIWSFSTQYWEWWEFSFT